MGGATKKKKKKEEVGTSLDGSSHKTGDAAFDPAMPHGLQHFRANTDSHNSHNTQHTRIKQIKLCFMQKGTQPSQTCFQGHVTPNPPHRSKRAMPLCL
jgi:hypothetical protein